MILLVFTGKVPIGLSGGDARSHIALVMDCIGILQIGSLWYDFGVIIADIVTLFYTGKEKRKTGR